MAQNPVNDKFDVVKISKNTDTKVEDTLVVKNFLQQWKKRN